MLNLLNKILNAILQSNRRVQDNTGADGLSAQIDFADTTPGSQVQIQFSGDARQGPEVVTLTGTLDITFVGGEAATLDAALTDAVPAPSV